MQAAADRRVTDLHVPLGHQQAAHDKDLTQKHRLLPDLSMRVIPPALWAVGSSDENVRVDVPAAVRTSGSRPASGYFNSVQTCNFRAHKLHFGPMDLISLPAGGSLLGTILVQHEGWHAEINVGPSF